MPWEELSPLAAGVGTAAAFLQGKKEREQTDYERQQAAQKASVEQAYLDIAKRQAGIGLPAPPQAPWATGAAVGTGTAMGKPTAPPAQIGGKKVLGQVNVTAQRPKPKEPTLLERANQAQAMATYYAQNGAIAQAQIFDAQARELYTAYHQAAQDYERYVRDTTQALHWVAMQNHWSRQDIERVRHDLQNEAAAIQRGEITYDVGMARASSTIQAANIGAASRTTDVKLQQTGAGQRQGAALKAFGSNPPPTAGSSDPFNTGVNP